MAKAFDERRDQLPYLMTEPALGLTGCRLSYRLASAISRTAQSARPECSSNSKSANMGSAISTRLRKI